MSCKLWGIGSEISLPSSKPPARQDWAGRVVLVSTAYQPPTVVILKVFFRIIVLINLRILGGMFPQENL